MTMYMNRLYSNSGPLFWGREGSTQLAQHSTVTALHTLKQRSKGVNQMAPPTRTITVTLDMSKAFDTINIHTLI